MLFYLSLILFAIAFSAPQYEYSDFRVVPEYIKRALQQKNHPKPVHREKTRTLSNLTLQQVFDKIKDITKKLNQNAKKNGYKVDYKFRILDVR